MVKNVFILFLFGFLLISCNVFKCKKKDVVSKLEGNWELSYITGPRIVFEGLYPDKKPTINFNTKENLVSGNNSCNSYRGQLNVSENKINFKEPMVTTKMRCIDGQSEQVFMSTLSKVTSYNVTDDGRTLNFISGNIETMRFTKR